MPYKDADWVKKVEEIYYSVNLRAFGLQNKREITTHVLSIEDKNSLTKDFVTGLQIVDPDGRIYILEGLREGGIKEFHK